MIGSTGPMMPMTGYFNSRREARGWAEGNLAHWNGYFTLRGKGEVAFDGETVQTRPGELLLLAPGHPRRYRIPEPRMGWEFYWLHFRSTPRLTSHLPWFDPATRWQLHAVADVSLRVTLATQLEAAHHFNLTEPDLPGREPIVEALLEAFLLRVAAAQARPEGAREMDPRIEQVLEQFHCELAAPFNIDRLAAHAGLSRSQFCLLFRRGTGLSPQAYMEARRLEMAAHYLRTTAQSVADVAEMVGFASPFYFTNRFRRRFGRSPSDYRAAPQGAR
ncbi:AraC family transcriptional regulator [Roseateles sp. DJS-2-20]|uniref:AraC family transcriptional regulator n=2 Tax=Roseateles paludis TaxID=3145238 RepID=A0ABV0G2I2_9BURK